jgi:hypothetical protein
MMMASLVIVWVALAAEPAVGPRLSEAEFFAALDESIPGVQAVRAAAQREDWPAARHAFAQYIRQRTSVRWLPQPKRPEQHPATPANTGTADALLRHQWRWSGRIFDLGRHIDWAANQMDQGESATKELDFFFPVGSRSSAIWPSGIQPRRILCRSVA